MMTIDTETLQKLESLLAETHHVIQFGDYGWIIAHPLKERIDGSLFDCRANLKWDSDLNLRGKYWLLDDGIVGEKYDSSGMIYIDNKRMYCTICDDYGHN